MTHGAASPMSFGELIGVRVLQDGDDEVVCELRVTGDHLNQGLIAQGGVLFTLADVALGLLLNREDDRATWVSTTFGLQLFRGAGVGDEVRARAVVEHRSRSLRACRVTLTRGGDAVLIGSLTNQAVQLPARVVQPVEPRHVVLRRVEDESRPLDRALAAARERAHGRPHGSPATAIVAELDGVPVGTGLVGRVGECHDVWVPTHHRGTAVESAVTAALTDVDPAALEC